MRALGDELLRSDGASIGQRSAGVVDGAEHDPRDARLRWRSLRRSYLLGAPASPVVGAVGVVLGVPEGSTGGVL